MLRIGTKYVPSTLEDLIRVPTSYAIASGDTEYQDAFLRHCKVPLQTENCMFLRAVRRGTPVRDLFYKFIAAAYEDKQITEDMSDEEAAEAKEINLEYSELAAPGATRFTPFGDDTDRTEKYLGKAPVRTRINGIKEINISATRRLAIAELITRQPTSAEELSRINLALKDQIDGAVSDIKFLLEQNGTVRSFFASDTYFSIVKAHAIPSVALSNASLFARFAGLPQHVGHDQMVVNYLRYAKLSALMRHFSHTKAASVKNVAVQVFGLLQNKHGFAGTYDQYEQAAIDA